MHSPPDRGPLSAHVLAQLQGHVSMPMPTVHSDNPIADGDLQLALFLLYELHHGGLDDVDVRLEWDPDVLRTRTLLEAPFEAALRRLPVPDVGGLQMPRALRAVVDADEGPPLSTFLMRSATLEQWREYLAQRSVYHLREADPHTWAIPRLRGRAKAALVEIQADEYGGGRADDMHSTLFARALRALDVDDTYGAHWHLATAETLATVNAMSLFGLHRRLRGAAVGHLAAFEMTSTTPNRRYGNGLRRLGLGPEATRYFDEHVEADAVHEQVAAVDLAGALVADEPELREDVLLGAVACLALDRAAAAAMLRRWAAPTSDLDVA